MAYASLLSLGHTLEQIIFYPDNQSLLHQTEQQLIKSLHKKVGFLLDFLDVIAPESIEKTINFETRIRDAAYKAEDVIESQIYSKQIRLESHVSDQIVSGWDRKYSGLQKAKEELDTISEDLVQMKDSNHIRILQPAESSKSGSTNKSVILGFDDEMEIVKNRLSQDPPELFINSIVGMPGIGKTTLARMIYNDSHTAARFNVRAWVTVSQEFHEQQVLEQILNSIRHPNHEQRQQSIDKLAENLYKRLKHKRFLIVMDDVWDAAVVEKIKRQLPHDNNGSRILLTTRDRRVARGANTYMEPYNLRSLTDEDCWNLLCHKVFGIERCPAELVESGKQISLVCHGLPLAIVLTAGFLCKAELRLDHWKYIEKHMHYRVDFPEGYWDIVSFFYNQLPYRLRACFLHMGVLPEDHEIRRSKLIKLWAANKFIKPHNSKSLEEVAEEYLQDLVDRNLIMVREWTHSGEIKTCCIHDVIRDFILMKAKEEKIDSEDEYFPEVHNNLRHVSILSDTIPKFRNTQNRELLLRSVAFFSHNSPNDIHFVTILRLLRILDALTLSLDEFPLELVELDTLRYIALSFWLKHGIPVSISKLCNLEMLIINPGKLRSIFNATLLPPEIWKLSRLRHLLFVRGFLPYPTEALNGGTYVLLENLQTLTNVVNFRWTEEVLLMMQNLKKLVTSYEHDGRTEWSSYCFDNFVLLHQLEVLKCFFFGKCYMKYQEPFPINFSFPQKLKRLTLSGCRISWKDMTIVSSLPSLQVLKLRFHAFEGSVWEPNNGEFRQLKFLLIHMTDLEHWKADETHFPSLERLTLNYCYNLMEIPSRIGKIPTLQEINLRGCSTSAVTSVEVIREEQRKLGNNGLKVMLTEDEDDANVLS